MSQYRVMHVMLNTGIGGMEEVFRHYNLALSDFCDIISVIDRNCKRKEFLTANSLKVIELERKFGGLSGAIHLRKIAKKHKIDFVIAHGADALTFSRLGLIGMGIRNISVRHTFFSSKLSALKWRLKADINIVINKKLLTDIGGKKTHLIYNVVGCDVVNRLEDKDLSNKVIKIGFLGRIVQQKGAQFLIKALGLLTNKKGFHCEVIIGGDGRYIKTLKHLTLLYGLNDKVKFVGYVSDKEKFFEEIDIFCLPSLKEAFGLVILESMARGVPVVASNTAGIDEIINHETNGLLFRPGDYHDLANKIEMLIVNESRRNLYVHNALANVKKLYTMNRLRNDLQKLISSIL